jgi:hypothetical protein
MLENFKVKKSFTNSENKNEFKNKTQIQKPYPKKTYNESNYKPKNNYKRKYSKNEDKKSEEMVYVEKDLSKEQAPSSSSQPNNIKKPQKKTKKKKFYPRF